MKYPDTVKVTYKDQSDDGGGGFAEGSETTVYDGKADVQDGSEALRQIADAGLQGRGDAVVFLPPTTSIKDSGILEGHAFEWENMSRTGQVVGITRLDDKLMVSFD